MQQNIKSAVLPELGRNQGRPEWVGRTQAAVIATSAGWLVTNTAARWLGCLGAPVDDCG